MGVPRQEAARVLEKGRVLQKARTRDALVAATRALLRDGVTPSVEQAADAARVSRTTAYRYFSSQRELLAATFPHLEGGTLLGDNPPADVRARVALFAEKMTESILANEAEMRAMLRLSLDPQVPQREVALRGGRRQLWVADALAPLRFSLPSSRFERLTLAIAATAGIESFVWLVDVGGVDRETAAAVIKSNCAALLEHELRRLNGCALGAVDEPGRQFGVVLSAAPPVPARCPPRRPLNPAAPPAATWARSRCPGTC
jgi:AcrR family transcriptional regulator